MGTGRQSSNASVAHCALLVTRFNGPNFPDTLTSTPRYLSRKVASV